MRAWWWWWWWWWAARRPRGASSSTSSLTGADDVHVATWQWASHGTHIASWLMMSKCIMLPPAASPPAAVAALCPLTAAAAAYSSSSSRRATSCARDACGDVQHACCWVLPWLYSCYAVVDRLPAGASPRRRGRVVLRTTNSAAVRSSLRVDVQRCGRYRGRGRR